ncbi:MAG: acyltransferase [Deltaproteobacteria bacterium]|nr:acyltransferase [Deltaproteobacteria bacterium]
MRKDNRPYIIKKTYLRFQRFYTKRFLKPQFEHLGRGALFMKPWNVEVFGSPVSIGDFSCVIASPDKKIRFSIWTDKKDVPGIKIGDYSLICPGTRISAAQNITIGDSCMIASNVYITDSDWHDIYDRALPVGTTRPVIIDDNVWVGDSAIICKGVSIGKNSIIGAGSVVTCDIPANVIAAGNPAKIVKELDGDKEIKTRKDMYKNPKELSDYFDYLDQENMGENTFLGWLRAIISPTTKD